MKTLRPYQEEAVEALCASLAHGHASGLLCLPTGSGKTFTALSFLDRLSSTSRLRVLWVAHRAELLEQMSGEAQAIGTNVDITQCMILSYRNLERVHYDVVVIDEAHHQAAVSYEGLRSSVSCDYYLGLTATPTRLDEKDLDFHSVVYQKAMLELVDAGYLARPKYIRVRTGMDFRMHSRGGDFTRASLSQLDNQGRNMIISSTLSDPKWGPTLLFAVDIEHARSLVEIMSNDHGLDVRVVTGRSPAKERGETTEWFNSADRPVLINCALYTEGLDIPRIKTIALARPTASEVMYSQMVGRGCRLHEGKDEFYILDFVDMSNKYGVLSAQWIADLGALPDNEDTQEDLDLAAHETTVSNTRDEIRELAAQMEMVNTVAFRNAREEPLEFYGFLRFGSKYWKRHKVIAVTTQQYRAVYKMAMIISGDPNNYGVVERSYAIACLDGEFTRQDWEKIGWAYKFWVTGTTAFAEGNITWHMIPLHPPTKEEKSALTAELVKEIDEADKKRKELNEYFKGDWIHNLFSSCIARAEERFGGAAASLRIFRPLRFEDNIMYVSFDGKFLDDISLERSIMEAMLEIVVGRFISLKVDYLQEN